MARSRDISKVLSSNSTLATDAEVAAAYAPIAAGGLVQITPTSIAATGGSGSISATGAVSFTSASAISLNGCFSSTYQNYRIILTVTAKSVTDELWMRLRSSGTDSTGTNYNLANYYAGTPAVGNGSLSTQTKWTFYGINSAAAGRNVYPIDIANPFLAQETTGSGSSASQGTTGFYWQGFALLHDAGSSYDGFTFLPQTGTFAGSIRIYGYRN
jgi:hypothetical protein